MMNRVVAGVVFTAFLLSACAYVPPGQIKKQSAPGQVQKETGYNPASGKVKLK